MNYKNYIAKLLSKHIELDEENIEKLIEIPPKSEMGDFAFPCFTLAKTMRKAPNMISSELKEKISDENFEKVEAFGPYLNFFVNKESLSKNIIEKILNEKENYGSNKDGEGKNVIVEYCSANIAKPFHVGHLFTTMLGNSLYKLFNFHGYNAIGINHLGDWGTQFGKLIYAYNHWGDEEALENDPIKEMLRVYVKFHEEADKNPALEDEGRKHFRLLEEGNEEEVKLWTRFKDLSLKEFDKLFKILNVSFDSFAGESFYTDKMDAVINEIDEKGLLTDSNGAKVVMLDEYNMPPCIVKKADGATIYATRDLAAAFYRKKTYDFYKNIYVVAKDQALHFKQVFTTIKLMGHDWADDCIHVEFGLVRFADKKLSTRKGDVVFLEDLLNEAVAKTLEIINEKNPDLENKEEVAKKVGIGAIVFTYLKNSRERDIVFNWDEMLSFEGETGPYVQYTYARGKSILRKVGEEVTGEVDYGKLNSKEEFELVKELASFENAINNAIEKLQPSVVTRYCIEVAKAFNKFYNAHNIANSEDEGLKNARINLVKSTLQVLKNGLGLIGLEVVDKM
ncbi:MAG: arginine--tRNA ligase [Clostridium argentinense]|uniref:Arginine--tRNA ligase n=1 Tax=Clostridium faecium TaxID=2762223 RepID=A0ABR8YQ15_9CLOT|nr:MULTISPECIES: arginine--tRNA ligase [Clostridium]MBD8046345.1 arginine--tRNA ligase [Clostridium faecium]MBS5823795.1 arginine--tRNA ligase [Clostridium argentinense]MDU1350173.1 arginine--tRNA ligase [Clostridium argentinense]